MASTTISNLPNKTPTGNMYTVVEDSNSTGKATINDIVASSSVIGTTSMGTTATTVTGAIAEHESDINELNDKNYTNVTASQTLLEYISLLSNGSYFVYSSTLTGGPHTSCYYRIYKHSTYAYVVATRAASDKLTYDAYITPSTSAIAWTKIPTRAEIDTLNGRFAYASGISLDTLTASGLYWVDSASDGPSFLPGGTSCLVIVIGTSTWCKQIATPVNNNGIQWERLRSSGTWGDWKLIRDRTVVSANSTQTVTLPIWGVYLVSCTSHLWLVNIQGAAQTPTVINLTGTTESNRTCVGVTNQNKITLGNTSTSNWAFGIICMA